VDGIIISNILSTTQAQITINDWDSDLHSFHLHCSVLWYRNPVENNDMLQMVGELEMKKTVLLLSTGTWVTIKTMVMRISKTKTTSLSSFSMSC
jgi:hypothetical protein